MTLKECRKKRGLSQAELATCVGLKQTTISQYENGSRRPKLSIAKKIATVLKISLDEFVCLSTFGDSVVEDNATNSNFFKNNPEAENKQISLFDNNPELQVLK